MQRFENKYDLLNAAYKDPELKKGAIALLQYLVHKSNKEQCFPAVDTIATALNVCKRTVQYNMRKLEKAGYIIRKDRWYNHQQLTNRYAFNLGIIEDIPGKMKFTDEEYETLNQVSFHNPDRNIHKISDIQKIYKMNLTSREKLLLVYLYHRANRKGIVYDSHKALMEAVGIRRRSLMHLLHSLHDKGLLKVKYTTICNQEYFIMQLTGKIYKTEENAAEEEQTVFVHSVQKDVKDQNQETEKKIQNVQNRKIIRKKFSCLSFRIFMANFMANLKDRLIFRLDKIRKILRI